MNTFIADTAERSRPYRIVGVAAVLLAAVVVGVMFAVSQSNRPRPTGGVPVGAIVSPSASPAQTPATGAIPTTNPIPTTSPIPTTLAATNPFVCGASTAFTKASYGLLDAVRTGAHAGYDRLTIQFQGGQPASIKLQPQAGTSFTRDGIGDTVKVAGHDGLLVSMFSTDAHSAYTGSADIKTGFSGLREVRLVGDYEGYVHWALGLSTPACYRAVVLTNPARLVIDIQTS